MSPEGFALRAHPVTRCTRDTRYRPRVARPSGDIYLSGAVAWVCSYLPFRYNPTIFLPRSVQNACRAGNPLTCVHRRRLQTVSPIPCDRLHLQTMEPDIMQMVATDVFHEGLHHDIPRLAAVNIPCRDCAEQTADGSGMDGVFHDARRPPRLHGAVFSMNCTKAATPSAEAGRC